MVELGEREQVLKSLKSYLEDLLESGLDELPFGEEPSAPVMQPPAPATPPAAPLAAPVPPAQAPPAVPPALAPASSVPAPAAPPAVVSVGDPRARLLLVQAGAGFAGEPGELLAKIIVAMGFAVEEVCLLSFAPGEARDAQLRGALLERIAAVGPEVVVALGEEAAQCLMESRDPIAGLRGRFLDLTGIPLMATLHPCQLVADPSLKRELWNEMKQVMQRLSASVC